MLVSHICSALSKKAHYNLPSRYCPACILCWRWYRCCWCCCFGCGWHWIAALRSHRHTDPSSATATIILSGREEKCGGSPRARQGQKLTSPRARQQCRFAVDRWCTLGAPAGRWKGGGGRKGFQITVHSLTLAVSSTTLWKGPTQRFSRLYRGDLGSSLLNPSCQNLTVVAGR